MAPATDIPLGNFIRCKYCGTVFMLNRDTHEIDGRGYISSSGQNTFFLQYDEYTSTGMGGSNHITNARILPRPGRI
jgi:hypothetical protein